MPGSGTHTTVIQHLAQENLTFQGPLGSLTAQELLGKPNLNMSWGTYFEDDALKSRYAILGAMGPDIFYAMLDYGSDIQMFEDIAIKVLGTFECVGQVSGEVSNLIDGAVNVITFDVWKSISDVFTNVGAVLKEGALDVIIEEHNFWSLFLPLRQVDDFRSNWYWADYLHYVKTGAFTQKLLDMSRDYSTDETTTGFLKAYALGYLTHYVADTVGHAYVNRIVESPWRNCWQRHHLVENFIDAYLWDHWHNVSTIPQKPADEQGLDETIDQTIADNPARRSGDGAPLHYARLNDLSNIGGVGIDKTVDAAITAVCDQIHSGLFNLGLSSVPPHSPSDDAAFITWTNFMSDAMQQTYALDQDHPNRLTAPAFLPTPDPCRKVQGGYPTPDDIAAAYGAYRMILSLATEDNLTAPPFPDIVGDISKILDDLWNQINQNLGNIPPPPPIPSSGGFSLDALWDAIKSYGQWLGQVAAAVLKTVGDIIAAAAGIVGTALTEPIKVALWLLNSALFAVYRNFRMKLVLAAYSVPFTDDLNGTQGQLDLKTLWTTMAGEAQPYPIEPLVSQRDLASDSTHPHSPYHPYFKPSDVMPAPNNVEMPATFAPTELLAWATPDDVFEKPLGKDNMFMASGPAPATTAPLMNHDGTVNTTLKTFDGTQRYFGGIFANCEAALRAAVPYVAGGSWPEGTVLPDYNLDSDRGYAWPCWDVDYSSKLPWNGCDPYPTDTVMRSKGSPLPNNISAALSTQPKLSWGLDPPPPRAGMASVDPFGKMPRSGQAFVNASPIGDAGQAFPTFSWITVDPSVNDLIDPETPTLDDLDKCEVAVPVPPAANLTADYRLAPMEFLQNDPNDSDFMDPDPADAPPIKENDGRLSDFLRAHANLRDPLSILANAVNLSMKLPVVLPNPAPAVPSTHNLDALVTAVAQLAITGRDSFSQFNSPQDSDLIQRVKDRNQANGIVFDETQLPAVAHNVLDMAYLTLWAIRGNDPGWRKFRDQIDTGLDSYFHTPGKHFKWIAVSGFDDTSHRPINVPTAPYPQFDIKFSTGPFGKQKPETTTRYMVASAHTWVGPNDPSLSSFTAADPAWSLLEAPPGAPFSSSPAPRTVPNDEPTIPPGNEIIVYIHGGGSRAEEAVALANWLIYEGSLVGHNYTVISLDLPNSAYATRFQVLDVVDAPYDPQKLQVLNFELQYIRDFINALELKLGLVPDRIKAVMGGSLGGNMSLLLSTKQVSGLETIVAWSVTAVSSMYYFGFVSVEWVATFLKHLQDGATDSELTGTPPEDHSKETEYIHHVYFEPLNPTPIPGVLPYMPPDPIMWYRGPDPVPDTPTVIHDWGQCKKDNIKASRFDRYEIYSEQARHWTNAIDLEQISFSFHDDCAVYGLIASSPGARLLLASGDRDNFAPNAIYNSTLELAHLIRHTAHGKAEFWFDTGHSLHSERPHLFAKDIVYFLTHLDAPDSPFGTVGAPQPAPFSATDE
jgi:hypothetical protein